MKGFGIMKFTDVNSLIEMMRGYYGVDDQCFSHIHIMNEDDFYNQTVDRFIWAFYADKFAYGVDGMSGVFDNYYDERAMEISEDCINDFPVDYNFILWSQTNQCYYCSLMEFKDDHASEFDDEQWDILMEIYDLFNIIKVKEQAYHTVETWWLNCVEDPMTPDDVSNYLVEANLVPYCSSPAIDIRTEQYLN